jgi:4-amino-4-deoxy-L-arabinose transferase-like glycosyltransferase
MQLPRIALFVALGIYLAATLPHLADFPLMGQDEPWIAAPAAKLAMQGILGNDLFAGYYGMDQRTYNFPPLFLISLAAAFRAIGVGALQARLVAIGFGAATLLLTYELGRRLYQASVGAFAALLLVGLRLTFEPLASGVPFLDLARIARYDIAVPPWMLATLLAFIQAEAMQHRTGNRLWYLACGMFAGLALLAHVYGAFVLAVVGILLLWKHGVGLLRQPAPYLIAAGCLLALMPWALWIAFDLANYRGQMLPEQTRFRVWDVRFYLEGLSQEPQRYARFFSENGNLVLWPRLGIWLVLVGLPASLCILVLRLRTMHAPLVQNQAQLASDRKSVLADRMLLIALPMIMLLLALLVNLKFYNYLLILLPFVALNLAFLADWIWRWAASCSPNLRMVIRIVLVFVGIMAATESGLGIYQSLAHAARVTPYAAYTARIAAVIPANSRVLALHPYWFGLYSQQYQYRSIVLSYYLSDPATYQPTLSMEEALAQIAPEYVLIDDVMARELQLDQPIEALSDTRMRGFRRYLQLHNARAIAYIDDATYGALTVYHLQL